MSLADRILEALRTKPISFVHQTIGPPDRPVQQTTELTLRDLLFDHCVLRDGPGELGVMLATAEALVLEVAQLAAEVAGESVPVTADPLDQP